MALIRSLTLIASCLLGSQLPASEPLAFDTPADDLRIELREIDDEIKRSEEARNRYLAMARRHEDEGMRWQFMQDYKQEAKRAFQKADAEKQAAKMLQERIDTLRSRRAEILQKHPEYNNQ